MKENEREICAHSGYLDGRLKNGKNSTLGYWQVATSPVLLRSVIRKKLVRAGYLNILERYEQLNQRHLSLDYGKLFV